MRKCKIIVIVILCSTLFVSCGKKEGPQETYTFLQLGARYSPPYKRMLPITKSITEKYGDQLNVVVHDIRLEKGIAEKYNANRTPTQILLDPEGNEIYRHIGFLAEDAIDSLLQTNGLIILDEKPPEK